MSDTGMFRVETALIASWAWGGGAGQAYRVDISPSVGRGSSHSTPSGNDGDGIG